MQASAIILINKDKQILLQKRDHNTIRYPGRWGFFGGGIENNETPEECVLRECYEELGYNLKNPKLVHKGTTNLILKQYVFVEEYDPLKKLILGEGEEMKWFSLGEVNSNKEVIPFVRKILNKIKDVINNQS